MENRPYFIMGDFVSNIVISFIAALVSALLVDPGWNMFVAMFVCMAVGMIISMAIGVTACLILFGAMEVMLPTMLTGMLSGMVVGMWDSMVSIKYTTMTLISIVIACGVLGYVYYWNSRLVGKVNLWSQRLSND